MQLLMFSKMLGLHGLDVKEAGKRIKELGFDGVDLTVRPGGHVLPERVKEDLPRAVETLERMGLSVPMITTAITDATEPYAVDIFRTAHFCGVKYIKLGYWPYREFGTLFSLMQRVKALLPALEALARETAITAALHIHSGKFLTANPAVVWWLLQGHDPDFLGAYIDPGHMVIEGGSNGWMQGMDLLSSWIRIVAVKDFGWEAGEDPQTGEPRWRLLHLPLKKGMVPWREVFRLLRSMGFDGPVSLHSEYEGLSLEALLAQTKEDLEYVRSILARL